MRKFLVAAAIVLAVAASAHSAAFTGQLNDFRVVLAGRLSTLSGQTDAQSKARSKAIAAALKRIDRAKSASLANDVSIVSAISGSIERAFGANDADLETTFDGILSTALDLRSRTTQSIAKVPDAAMRARLTGLLAKADPFLATAQLATGPDVTVTVRSHALKAAMAKIEAVSERTTKALDACGPGIADEFTAQIDDPPARTAFDPPGRDARLETGRSGAVNALVVEGFTSGPANVDELISFTIYGAFLRGKGTYPVKRRVVNGDLTPVALADFRRDGIFVCDDAKGTLDVTAYDRKHRRVAGSFDVTFTTHDLATPNVQETHHVTGSFRICDMTEHMQQ